MKNYKGELIRKIALLRILLRKPKLVILQDTSQYIDHNNINIFSILKQEIPDVTILMIGSLISRAINVTRIVSMEHMEIVEDGDPE